MFDDQIKSIHCYLATKPTLAPAYEYPSSTLDTIEPQLIQRTVDYSPPTQQIVQRNYGQSIRPVRRFSTSRPKAPLASSYEYTSQIQHTKQPQLTRSSVSYSQG